MEFFNLTETERCKPLVVLTAGQAHYIASVILKTGIVINKKHVFATNCFQNVTVLGFFCFWTNANDSKADTFLLKRIKFLLSS